MRLLRSVAMAFSMFSAIPAPPVKWERDNMRYMLCALPLVGALIGAALWLWSLLCAALRIGTPLCAAGMALLPLALSGGIHLDGFCDTVDALASHAPPERKREILKDPHTGAFGAIFVAAYLLALFAVDTELAPGGRTALAVGAVYTLSRALGALAGTLFPGSGKSGLLAQFHDAAASRAALVEGLWCALCAAALLCCAPVGGAAALLAGAAALLGVRRMSVREFGGMSGDLAGYLISVSELAMLAGYVFAERAVGL